MERNAGRSARLAGLPLLILSSSLALAAETTAAAPPPAKIGMSQIFIFSFLMLGPIKILGPFVQMTNGADKDFRRRFAIRGFFVAFLALVMAAILGERILKNFSIPVAVLVMSAGLILFLVALKAVLEQFESRTPNQPADFTPSMRLAVSPLAFPTIVTPYGVAAVIIFMQLSPDLITRMEVLGALAGIMLLNLIAMLFAPVILKWAGMPLLIFGTVLGIIQVALGLKLILMGLAALGLITPRIT